MTEINWNKWSSIAEIVSSIAILVTLAYLAIQTRQNTDALNSQSRLGMFELGQMEFPIWMEYPELTSLIIDNDLEMSLEDKIRLDSMLLLSLSRREFAWREYRAGTLDQESWDTEFATISLLMGTERTRDWWNNVARFNYDEEFSAVVNSTIEGKPLDPYWEKLRNW